MRAIRFFFVACVGLLALAISNAVSAAEQFAVGPQYDTTHIYVAPADFDRFVTALLATFGGTASKKVLTDVTPTPSRTWSQAVLTPSGSFSVFGFETPIPYPFGSERTGYLVTDLDGAVAAARTLGAGTVVTPFSDPIGRDAVVQWPGGVSMQFYWHKVKPSYPALAHVPENRVYVSPDMADKFVASFVAFARGRIVADDRAAPGTEIGRPKDNFRRIRLESGFGKVTVLVTDGHLPYPYGRELTGYAVADLGTTLAKAKSAGAVLLTGPYRMDDRTAAMIQFPGGYIAEIHAAM